MNVIELFAGVGGFRVGLNEVNTVTGEDFFKTIWSNQYEPSTKTQHASRIYVKNFGSDGHVNKDINEVSSNDIPDCDLLCGGFPCQDYSVASTLDKSGGIEGKKGVLWWQIVRILKDKKNKPELLMFENVDRLLVSPSKQRGRDFAIILKSLDELGYVVEWRIINAADYGFPQKRKRTYILGYRKDSKLVKNLSPTNWMIKTGVFASAFPVLENETGLLPPDPIDLNDYDLVSLSQNFNKDNKKRYFENTGVMVNGLVYTEKTIPCYRGQKVVLKDVIVQDENLIPKEFWIKEEDVDRWKYLKGYKRIEKTSKDGHKYFYCEGAMTFPDSIENPSRTIITSEGGSLPSRFKHVIVHPSNGKMRRLLPVELERLNMFPDNHTEGESDNKRAFFMGNALVTGIVTELGKEIRKRKTYFS